MEQSAVIGDLLVFLDTLPPSFAKGSREQLAVRELLWRLIGEGQMPEDCARLKTLIAPLVCGTADQQREFYSRFDEWIAPPPPPPPPPLAEKLRWPIAAVAFLLAAAIVGSVAYYRYLFQPIPALASPRPPAAVLPSGEGSGIAESAEYLRGAVVSPDGLPLRNAAVRIPAGVGAEQPLVYTDAQGRFTIRLVRPTATVGGSSRGSRVDVLDPLTGKYIGSTGRPTGTLIPSVNTVDAPLLTLKFKAADVAFSPDGRILGAVGPYGDLRSWDLTTGKELGGLVAGEREVTAIAFSPDGRMVATSGVNDMVWISDMKDQRHVLFIIKGFETGAVRMVFSPDGRELAAVGKDGTAGIWSLQTLRRLFGPYGAAPFINDVAFSPDGRNFATAARDGTASVWDVRISKEILRVKHADSVRGVAFSPDGRRFATASQDGAAAVWDAATGKQILMLRGNSDFVKSVSFSADMRRLATAGSDGTVRIWDLTSGLELNRIATPTHFGSAAECFSPDGRRIATAANDLDIRIFDVSGITPGSTTVSLAPVSLNLLITHADYEPAYLENVNPGYTRIQLGALRTGRRVLARMTGSRPQRRRYPIAVSVLLGAIPLLASILLFMKLRKRDHERKAFLEKFETHLDLAPVRVYSRSEEGELFQSAEVSALAVDLRRRRPEPTAQIAIEPTVHRTAERAGIFTPVHRERYGAREYLVILESKNGNDHQARFWSCLIDRLAARDVWIDLYQFQGDPRICDEPRAERSWITLEEIASLHPRHELWVLSEAERFFDRATRAPAPWIGALSRWSERAVLRLTEGSAEDCEQLGTLGFAVSMASIAGIAGLNPDTVQKPDESHLFTYPLVLEQDESRWLQGLGPGDKSDHADLRILDRQLRAWLGANGYLCLLACAVYPGVAWNLTLHMAIALIPGEERDETLARLVRLPWFRHGRMPQWLREFFIGKLSATDSARVLKVLQDFLESKREGQPRRNAALDFVKITQELEDQRKPPTRDYVFLSYLLGWKPRLKDIAAPDWLRRLLYPDGMPVLNLRREWWLAAGAIACALILSATEWFAHPRPLPQTVKWTEIAAPLAVNAEPVNSLSARALEIAASRLGKPVDNDHPSWSFDRAVQFSSPKGGPQSGPVRPGTVFQPNSPEDPPALVEEVVAGGLIVLEPREGALRRVFRPMRELDGVFNEIGTVKTKVNPRDGLTYIWIPPGSFTMGCSPGDNECDPDEKPAHQVTLTKGFWIGQTPVTQEAYQRVTGKNPSYFKGSRLPVESIDWNEAQSYCSAVNMRLPTEAEWEYAARAGSSPSRYGPIDAIAWYSANSGGKTHEVAQKQPNAWGVYDTLGNVWQWAADWYAANYPPAAIADPQGPPTGESRVLRGGSWGYNPRGVRVSYRSRGAQNSRHGGIGFRCGGE